MVGGGGGEGRRDPKLVANWVINELFGQLSKAGKSINDIPPERFAGLIDLVVEEKVSARSAKEVLTATLETGQEPATIVEKKGLKQVTDAGAIEATVDQVLAEAADEVAAYKAGKEKLFGFFMGQVMRATQGKVSPKLVNEILRRKLGGR